MIGLHNQIKTDYAPIQTGYSSNNELFSNYEMKPKQSSLKTRLPVKPRHYGYLFDSKNGLNIGMVI